MKVAEEPSYVANTTNLHQNNAEAHIGASRPGLRIM